MKVLICGDVHWSQYSSILRKRGKFYSERLEYLLDSINWVEESSSKLGCDRVIYLGDFFDKPSLNDEEISALMKIKWNTSIPHDFVVGNHESSVNGLRFNSTRALERDGFNIWDKPSTIKFGDKLVSFLPYVIEDDRKPLKDYFDKSDIIFSHNDIKGISFGAIESKTGFEIDDILNNCGMFINGHLHNGTWVKKDRIRNLGNICGQNFGEDSFTYKHNVMILDTDTLQYEDIENPFALNFVQINIEKESDVESLSFGLNNMVVNFKCNEELVSRLKEKLTEANTPSNYRIMAVKSKTTSQSEAEVIFNTEGYLQKFSKCVLEKIGNSDIVKEEIMEVIK